MKGQFALVTGGSTGIGEGCVRHLAAAGAAVAINYIVQPEVAQKVAEDINGAGGRAILVQADVSNEESVLAMFESVKKEFGTLDILVSNAGIQKDSAFKDMTVAQWDAVLNVNLKGAFLTCRSAVREFLSRERSEVSKARGKLILISSVHQYIPWAGHANYAASKGGMMLFMQSLAQELSSQAIRVNAICPGAIATNINRPAWSTPQAEQDLLKLIPYNRVGVPDDIGRTAVFLSCDASDYIVGASIVVDGGMCTFESFSTGG